MQTIITATTCEEADNMLHSDTAVVYQEGAGALNDLVRACHRNAVRSRWWHTKKQREASTDMSKFVWYMEPKELNFGERIALIHSEISEAMEAGRKDLPSDKITEFTGVEEELADTLIRIFDLAGAMKLRLGAAFVAKYRYNQTREDHKVEIREAEGGKDF